MNVLNSGEPIRIVTRHEGAVEWLVWRLSTDWRVAQHGAYVRGPHGLLFNGPASVAADAKLPDHIPVLAHVTVTDVDGCHVIGPLPLSLARHAASVTEIVLPALPLSLRGRELSYDEMRRAGAYLAEPVIVATRDRAQWIANCSGHTVADYRAGGRA